MHTMYSKVTGWHVHGGSHIDMVYVYVPAFLGAISQIW